MTLSLVEVTGGFASGRQATFERWLQDPGSLCEGASAATVSARLCAYGQILGYQHEHVEWDARSAGQKLLNASKDTTVGERARFKTLRNEIGRWCVGNHCRPLGGTRGGKHHANSAAASSPQLAR